MIFKDFKGNKIGLPTLKNSKNLKNVEKKK